MTKKSVIRWKNGLGGSGGLKRIFSGVRVLEIRKKIKKSVSIRPIRPIRSPIRITFFFSKKQNKIGAFFVGTHRNSFSIKYLQIKYILKLWLRVRKKKW
jgi:hypothetical protein